MAVIKSHYTTWIYSKEGGAMDEIVKWIWFQNAKQGEKFPLRFLYSQVERKSCTSERFHFEFCSATFFASSCRARVWIVIHGDGTQEIEKQHLILVRAYAHSAHTRSYKYIHEWKSFSLHLLAPELFLCSAISVFASRQKQPLWRSRCSHLFEFRSGRKLGF